MDKGKETKKALLSNKSVILVDAEQINHSYGSDPLIELRFIVAPKQGIYSTIGLQKFTADLEKQLGIAKVVGFRFSENGLTLGKLFAEDLKNRKRIYVSIFPDVNYAKNRHNNNWTDFISKDHLPNWKEEASQEKKETEAPQPKPGPEIEFEFTISCEVKIKDPSVRLILCEDFKFLIDDKEKVKGWKISEEDDSEGFTASNIRVDDLRHFKETIALLYKEAKSQLVKI